MIKNIVGGQGIVVSGGAISNGPYIDMTRPSAGMVRYNGHTFEVYDGGSWIGMSSGYPMVELSPDVHELLQWAKLKRDYEAKLADLKQQYPQIGDAVDNVKRSQEQLDLLLALAQDHTVRS